MDSQMKRHLGQSLEESRMQELLSPCSWGATPSWHMDMFTTWKLSKLLNISIFMEASLTRAQLIINSSL